jgi:hypothetical protein
MRIRLPAAAGGALLAAAAPLLAHHSFSAEFDAGKPVTLDGIVKQMEWVNPHSWIHIEVTRADGTVEEWKVEGGAPSALLRRGWNRDSLPPGAHITVRGFRAKDGSLRLNARDITFPDGKTLNLASSQIDPPSESDSPDD